MRKHLQRPRLSLSSPCPSDAVIAGLVVRAFTFSLLAVFVGIHFIKRIGERDRSMGKEIER